MTGVLKYNLTLTLIWFSYFFAFSQNSKIDSLLQVLKSSKEDTSKVFILNSLSQNLVNQKSDSAFLMARQALQLAQKLGYNKGVSDAYNSISRSYSMKGNIEKQIEFLLRELRVRESIGDKNSVTRCFGDLGSVYRHIPNKSVISINYFMKSIKVLYELLEIAKQKKQTEEILALKKKIAATFGSVGVTSWENGMYSNAIKYQLNGLKIWEELDNKKSIANTYNNIGIVYDVLGNYPKAIEYHKMALKTREIFLKDEKKNLKENEINALINAEANSYNNLGVVYEKQGNLLKGKSDSAKKMQIYNEALENLIRALQLFQETKNASGIPMTYDNIGNIYADMGVYDKSMEYFLKALHLRDEKACGDCKLDYSVTLISIGSLYYKQNNRKEAIENLTKALKISEALGSKENIKHCCEILAKIYFSLGDYKLAYQYLETCSNVKDSLLNAESYKQVAEMNAKYDSEKKENQIILLEKDKEKQEVESKKQKIIMYAISGGLCLVMLLALFIFRGYRQKKKAHIIITQQKQEVENKKQIIEAKNKDITDSITYAERILRSFIATKEILDENLASSASASADYFVLFKPKDVVSGDFYWASKLNNGKFAFVTADSTGHGVPGAIMSLLNITSLEKAIETLTEPSEILNATRKTIIERLKKDGSEHGGKDGMDASLTVYDFKNKKLIVAAANNPVWIVRKVVTSSAVEKDQQGFASPEASSGQAAQRDKSFEIIEIKPDKMPVGKHDKDTVSFTQQEIDLQAGDVVYTLTDGFPDQFGGEKGKKFMSKKLRELLAANAHLPMQEQKQLLEKTFTEWVGNLEQVDDVTIIGVRV
jgi:tetratricopeptide (TPR) repeat protein